MGPQQEYPTERDGSYDNDSGETKTEKQTDCLSSPKTASKLRENTTVQKGPSYAGVWREQGEKYGL